MPTTKSMMGFLIVAVVVSCGIALGADAPTTAPAGGAPPIAVIDLDKAARELGYAANLQSDLNEYRRQLQGEVKKFAEGYEAQVQSVARSMAPKGAKQPPERYALSPEQAAEVGRDMAAVRQQVAQLGQKAEQAFNAYRVEWVRHYREALTPVVQQVMRSRKALVVLVKSDTVMYAEPSTDITDAVIEAARANPPQMAPVPMARLEAPAEVNFPTVAPATQPAAANP